MNQLFPIIRRKRRPLLPVDEGEGATVGPGQAGGAGVGAVAAERRGNGEAGERAEGVKTEKTGDDDGAETTNS